jgi:hypothetical protein
MPRRLKSNATKTDNKNNDFPVPALMLLCKRMMVSLMSFAGGCVITPALMLIASTSRHYF